ncbi:hypothetical protein BVRB_8g187680 [Beta vulgaris subsp. vulgaris]|uniref:Arabidopsis retrotransposon Orf1 C-terminal domain-containing protein n=2 Tax=Beta vulgaris subsp. vulgaris TaxID=3555 RepID=A0A0J8BV80_BETVV|nr:hypothetical protein BVRB_8g187680 [Beta vulgaris subsp. vulgaris]
MLDLGASINVLPYSLYESVELGELLPTNVVIQLADRSTSIPRGVLKDVLVEVDKMTFPADFYVINMEHDRHSASILLGRPFLKTANARTDCGTGSLTMQFDGQNVEFKMHDAMGGKEDHSIYSIDVVKPSVHVEFDVRKRGRTQGSNEPEAHEEPAASEVMIDTMGLTGLNREQKVTWRSLCRSKRVVQCTKFLDTTFLAQLGLLDGFREMMGRAGLLGMLDYTPRTYKRCVYEFLSTLTLVKHRGETRIRFRMHDRVRDISMSQVREAFGWVAPSSDNPFIPMGEPSEEVGVFWYRIFGLPLSSGGEKISSIRHPGLRMAAYFLGMTIFCKGETGKLNQLEMCYLPSLLPGSVGIPDWADLWLKSCIDVRTKLGGHLSMGAGARRRNRLSSIEEQLQALTLQGNATMGYMRHLDAFFQQQYGGSYVPYGDFPGGASGSGASGSGGAYHGDP